MSYQNIYNWSISIIKTPQRHNIIQIQLHVHGPGVSVYLSMLSYYTMHSLRRISSRIFVRGVGGVWG